MHQELTEQELEHGRAFVRAPLPYQFTADEEAVLRPFFTNFTSRVFCMFGFLPNIGAALLAMYSRMKNKRGIRGTFVDTFLPQLLASFLEEVQTEFMGADGQADAARFLSTRKIRNLSQFVAYRSSAYPMDEPRKIFHEFLAKAATDPHYLELIGSSGKVKRFLAMWLDKYGHNSIARTASLWICCEEISILAAKSIEWTRPGAGYIELSTRYVDCTERAMYPFGSLFALSGADPTLAKSLANDCFKDYGLLSGDKLSGIFPSFLREHYGSQYAGREKEDLEPGIIGETYDVLGNLLPAATLTSVGIAVSGESFPSILKHLYLDNLPETIALAECMVEEAKKIGADQFARHFMPTPWERVGWQYLSVETFKELMSFRGGPQESSHVTAVYAPGLINTELILRGVFNTQRVFHSFDFDEELETLLRIPRGEHDKLPYQFESVSATMHGVMSFRGWRDLHRQGLSTHARTLLTPLLGFYAYDKPAPSGLSGTFFRAHADSTSVYSALMEKSVPIRYIQYALPLGNRVGFTFGANLRQHEFCIWQRTGWNVNHEVRQVFLDMERLLGLQYPWWPSVSRADRTPAYIFARGEKPIPLIIHE